MLDSMLARRRGTAPGSRARTADELAVLLDRAPDLSLNELHERVAPIEEDRRGDPAFELLDRGRAIGIDVPTGAGDTQQRVILTEHYRRYVAAFGSEALTTVYTGATLEPSSAASAVPETLQRSALTRLAARRDLLVRFVSLAGAVSIDEILRRYDFDRAWVEERLDDWTRTGRLVRGTFGGGAATPRWCSRRLLEQARRRELAQARKQIEAVDLSRFSSFVQQWQHVDSAARLSGDDGTMRGIRQLYGLARPAEQWEREYLPARVDGYDPDVLSRLLALGEMVWVGGSSAAKSNEAANLSSVRFLRRGTARAWLPTAETMPLSAHAQTVLDSLQREGASFFDEILSSTALTSRNLRDALRELVGAGLVTNDTMESLRHVVRWRPVVSPRDRTQADPTRWLPADFAPSADRYVVQRRPNLRRLPKWKRPDKEGAETTNWPGRWSLVRVPRVLGPEADDAAWAELIARQWLDRYGVVSREIWRRERPVIGWRSIYHELKRLEFRGEVRRGYFVRGLSGAQFAMPEAVEMLRAERSVSDNAEPVVMSVNDPANVFTLPMPTSQERDPFVRPRSRGALLVTVGGIVVLIAERRGARIAIRPGTVDVAVTAAARALIGHLVEHVRGDVSIETIDGQPASGSAYLNAFLEADLKRGTAGLRYYRRV
jgi:ATP-dependent Lhr-like helicase